MRPADTSPEAWKVFIDLQRKLSPAEKLQQAFEWSEVIRQFAEAGLRQRYPHADDREIFLREARQRLGAELFHKVYGKELTDEEPSRAGQLANWPRCWRRWGSDTRSWGRWRCVCMASIRPPNADLLAQIAPECAAALAAALGTSWYADAPAIEQAIRQGRPFNLIHIHTAQKIDIFPATSEFHATQLDRARTSGSRTNAR